MTDESVVTRRGLQLAAEGWDRVISSATAELVELYRALGLQVRGDSESVRFLTR